MDFLSQVKQRCSSYLFSSKRKREDDAPQQAANSSFQQAAPGDKRMKGNSGRHLDDCSGLNGHQELQPAAAPSVPSMAAAGPAPKQQVQGAALTSSWQPTVSSSTPAAATPGPRMGQLGSRRAALPLGGWADPSITAPLPATPAVGSRSQVPPTSIRKQHKERARTTFKGNYNRPVSQATPYYKLSASTLEPGRASSSSPAAAWSTPQGPAAAAAAGGGGGGRGGRSSSGNSGGGRSPAVAWSSPGSAPGEFAFQAELQQQQRGGGHPEPSTPTFQHLGAATPAPPARGSRDGIDTAAAAAVAAVPANRQPETQQGLGTWWLQGSGQQSANWQPQQQQQQQAVLHDRSQVPSTPAAAAQDSWRGGGGDGSLMAATVADLEAVAAPSSTGWVAGGGGRRLGVEEGLRPETQRALDAWEQNKQSVHRQLSRQAPAAAAAAGGGGGGGGSRGTGAGAGGAGSSSQAPLGLSPNYRPAPRVPELLETGRAQHIAQLKVQQQQLKSRLLPPPPATAAEDRKGPPAAAAAAARPRKAQAKQEESDEVVVLSSDDEEVAQGQQQQQQEEEPSSLGGEEYGEDEEEESEEEEEGAEEEEVEEGLEALGLTAGSWEPSREEVGRWQAAIGPGPPAEVLADHPRAGPLPREKMACLDRGLWLNDEVMNFYISLLLDRDKAMRAAVGAAAAAACSSSNGGSGRQGPPRCHFFSTFFLNKLFQDTGQYNYANVRRWTTKAKLGRLGQAAGCVLECDLLVVPVHEGSHWTCAAIDLRPGRRCLVYYDSLGGKNTAVLDHLARWVTDEAKDKLGQEWDAATWPRAYPKNIPRQTNGCDCGVFALLYANRLGLGAAWDFSQADLLVNARVRVTCELLEGRLRDMGPAAAGAGAGAAAGTRSNGPVD